MKNYLFLFAVLLGIALLFSFRYFFHAFSDTALQIALFSSVIVVLILREKLQISFSDH
ncbi:hypothetical protein [Jeotgalibacillus proteolyticus]|uniref:hypothetical protein n=1 Tax=Jeotgalibacillus proteolyticus TaxID=2082395 RepID=UPI001430D442|nr:hypothetical protein [Jeotgalibacillus proteolyticus]